MIQLYNDNCFNILPQIPDKSVDLILIDPPYNSTYAKWDENIDVEKLFKEYWRVLKDRGNILVFADCGRFMAKVINNKHYKYTLMWKKNNKTDFLHAQMKPMNQIETINVFYKKYVYNPQMIPCKKHTVNKHSNSGTYNKLYDVDVSGTEIKSVMHPTNILEFNVVSKKIHPSEKPVDLLEWLIKSYSNDDAVVMDTFMGSGSTGVAAKNLNRDFIRYRNG